MVPAQPRPGADPAGGSRPRRIARRRARHVQNDRIRPGRRVEPSRRRRRGAAGAARRRDRGSRGGRLAAARRADRRGPAGVRRRGGGHRGAGRAVRRRAAGIRGRTGPELLQGNGDPDARGEFRARGRRRVQPAQPRHRQHPGAAQRAAHGQRRGLPDRGGRRQLRAGQLGQCPVRRRDRGAPHGDPQGRRLGDLRRRRCGRGGQLRAARRLRRA